MLDHALAEDPCGPVEVEKEAAAITSAVLEDKMSVEQHRLDFGKDVVMAVQVRPAGLNHADLRIGKVVDRLLDEIGWSHEIGIEDGNELVFCHLQSCLQSGGFISF